MRNPTKILWALSKAGILTITFFSFQNCSGKFVPVFDPAGSSSSSSNSSPNSPGFGAKAAYSLTKTLSREESLNAAKDILGSNLVSDQLIYLLPTDEKTAGFESASVKQFNDAFVTGRLKFSEAIAEAALTSPQVLTCNPGFAENTAWAGCIQTIVSQFARRAFSRAPTSQELAEWQALYQSTARAIIPFLGTSLRGNLDAVSGGLEAQGWSLDPEWGERPIQVHFYVNGPAGSGTFAGATITRLHRPDVINFFRQTEQLTVTGNHGFSFQLPLQYANGQNHSLHAYALGGDGTVGSSTLLGTVNFRVNPTAQIPSNFLVLSASTKEGLKNVFTSILMSPSFQLREPPQVSTESALAYESRRLARKLALFISGSLPDPALLQAAESGELTNPQILRTHAVRLLDQHLARFASNSFGQWFGFRDFSRVSDLTSIERAMITESQLVFQEILRLELPIDSILLPGFTFINQELGNHYGLAGGTSTNFVKVSQQQRGGVLTQGSVLRLTSPTADTKVIQRGKWIMNNLLCETIPIPDNSLRENAIADSVERLPANSSVKETLAFHRSRSISCYNCHKQMDPLGLSLEVFDSFGRLRTSYPDSKPIEADGELYGMSFDGPYQLAPIIAQQQFRTCVTRKLFTHALGRDLANTEESVALGLSTSSSVKDLILKIVTSSVFLDEARRTQ